jgi:hypothetical protein
MTIKIVPTNLPAGKVADAELHFIDGPLVGLKLIGFGIWERKSAADYTVTFPARQYSVNGERRSFALLRPMMDGLAQERVRDLIIQAYTDFVKANAHEEHRYADPHCTCNDCIADMERDH